MKDDGIPLLGWHDPDHYKRKRLCYGRTAGESGETTVPQYRQHGSIDMVISDLYNAWRRTISEGNHPEAFIPGQEKAEELEPVLRKVLVQWL